MSESYEKLLGASGRAKFFRPRRHPAPTLFVGEPPRVWFDDRELTLENISASGAAVKTRLFDPDEPATLAGSRGVLRLTQRGREIFRAAARTARVDVERGSLIMGLALERGRFDLGDLVRTNARVLAACGGAVESAPEPSAAYKSFCADVVAFVGDYLDRIDRHLGPVEKALTPEQKHETVREMISSCSDAWRSLLQDGNNLVIPLHRNQRERVSLKWFTERVVTRDLIGGESWARSYFKPMGYPGDYRIMNFMYDNRPEGDTVRSQFLHMLGVAAGQPIVTRMTALAGLIADHGATLSGDAIKIMSIGCGPARELEHILADSRETGLKWKATLVDQEPEALDYALNKAATISDYKRLEAKALNISFKEMLNPSPLSGHLAEQDVIYSAGLVDYLNPLLAMRFVRRMYEYLKPGGKLIIGNVNDLPTGTLWPMEYVLDWTLYFRNREEMLAMAGETPDARVTIEEDYLNAIYFLVLEKPAE